jgi:proteasome lid subunit RPN8/RPN11
MMFERPIIEAIRQHAIAAFPREACGYVAGGTYVPCENFHPQPEKHFAIALKDIAEARGLGLQAIVHSHPGGPDCPSSDDMAEQVAQAVPFGIVSTDGKAATVPFWFGDQAPIPPLLNRTFRHGVTDCLSLIRDIYRLPRQEVEAQLGIKDWPADGAAIPEFPRDWEWWTETGDKNPNFYQACFEAAGFVEVDDGPRTGDVFRLRTPKSAVANHAGIYVGRGLAIHHLTSRLPVDRTRLAKRDPIGKWSNMIREYRWLRYRG